MSKHYSQKDNLISIMKEISKKTPRGIVSGDTQVGHITWQMYLMRDYLKLDGTPLANASNYYSDLLSFAQDNNLITADTTDNSLFKYNSTTDVLTLPNYIDLVLQGGNTVEEKEAGLPNIKGGVQPCISTGTFGVRNMTGAFINESHSNQVRDVSATSWESDYGIKFDASRSNSIYSDSVDTVQPPAIILIPQIKYRKATTMYEQIDAVVNYSTTEKVVGTWIDGKPLYQKTYSGTIPSGADSANVDIFVDSVVIGSLDTGFITEGYILNSGDYLSINENNESEKSSRIWISTIHDSIRGRFGTALIDSTISVTIQYTKTTD